MRNIQILIASIILVSCSPPLQETGEKSGAEYAKTAVVEATITSIQQGISEKKMSCLDVVNAYIERIETYDQSTTLNAVTYKNYQASRNQASEIDALIASGNQLPSLACVPILAKDNIDVKGFPTTAGSKMMLDNLPPDDAKIIALLKPQGAIVIAKTNMAEWAFSPKRTESTSAGITKNAYDLNYVPAGSSGGTASGIAASFALAGLGTDTGNSVRGPSSHLSLVGMRSTHGSLDLDGIIPLVLSADVVGPMTRTVRDNVMMLAAMGGQNYTDELTKDGLKNARIGIVRELANPDDMDGEVSELFEKAIGDLQAQGATVFDVNISNIEAHIDASWGCRSFRKDVHEYLTQDAMVTKMTDPYQAFEAGIYAPYTKGSWNWFKDGQIETATKTDGTVCGDLSTDILRQSIKADIIHAMDLNELDALVYPSWRYPPAHLDRAEQDYKGDNSQSLAPPTGLPAITIPMGFVSDNLPTGLQLMGRPDSEGTLYRFSYAYEQATLHRKPPTEFPPVGD
jgi:Asp-tRNA(Asn)/Glu-tRNA(Gln) amidotransferase A subunit family amidase